MSKKRSKRNEIQRNGSPAWMTTYSDLMSLLLTFFILLYSMSNIDAEKFKSVTASLQSILNGLGYTNIIEEDMGDDSKDSSNLDDLNNTGDIDEGIDMNTVKPGILEMYEKVEAYVAKEELEAQVSVSMNKRGVFVDIKEAILFESGSAEIKESGLNVLNRLEGLINDFENELVIEGHTDTVPSTGQYPTNWELSTARAVSVVRHLSEVEGVSPKRLSAVGYSEYRPIAPNDTRKNKSMNRRVNILIIFDEESDGVIDSGD